MLDLWNKEVSLSGRTNFGDCTRSGRGRARKTAIAHWEKQGRAAKGIGENPISPVAAAVANAIEDAVGVRIRDLPITAENIYTAVRENRRKDSVARVIP
ncbi:MAG: hypothetical protein ACREQ7_06455 [Candidatus Binatia bacterium]